MIFFCVYLPPCEVQAEQQTCLKECTGSGKTNTRSSLLAEGSTWSSPGYWDPQHRGGCVFEIKKRDWIKRKLGAVLSTYTSRQVLKYRV